MENSKNNLSLEQYRELYTKAFAKLADISQQAEEAMQALEEIWRRRWRKSPQKPPRATRQKQKR